MLAKWTGEVKGTMHIYEVSMQELADKLGISTTFLSSLLHCRRSTKDAEFRIRNALMDIVKSRESIE
jgi:hypothetical protein